MVENDKNKIKKLRRRLYSKNFKEDGAHISEFNRKKYSVNEEWTKKPQMSPVEKVKLARRRITIKRILIASIIFFIVSIGLAFFIIRNGSHVFSLKNVIVDISGPISVNGGDEFSLDIKVTNKNDTALEFSNLTIEYPKGSYASFDSQKELSRSTESLGKIGPNVTVDKKVSLVLFGSGNTKKEISFTLESRFAGSSAILDKTIKYNLSLASSPINLSVSVPKEIGTKQEFEITINLESNSNNTLNNLMLNVDYPSGFTFDSASPSPSRRKNNWDIGDMLPVDKRVIKIRGVIDGQKDAEKIFIISIGSKNPKGGDSIGTVYNSTSEQIIITKPFLGLRVLVNGLETPEYISNGNSALRFDVLWKSNSLVKTTDGNIEAKLSGNIANRFSVSPDKDGFYRSLDNTIVWSGRTGKNNLSVIDPGENGEVGFTLQPLSFVDKLGDVFKNPEITVTVKADGNQATETGEQSKMSSSISKKIKIESKLKIIPRAVYYTGPFKNTGLLPPEINKETTYTIILSVTNTSNKISSAIVKTTLPTYVRWMGIVSPKSEDISFNNVDGEVVWNVGNIDTGTGFSKGTREVAFKVGLTPSVSQINRMPLLTGDITIIGKDTFTGTILKDMEKGINTNLSSDPSFSVTQASIKSN